MGSGWNSKSRHRALAGAASPITERLASNNDADDEIISPGAHLWLVLTPKSYYYG